MCGEKDATQARPVRQLQLEDTSLAEATGEGDASDRATFLSLISAAPLFLVRKPVCVGVCHVRVTFSSFVHFVSRAAIANANTRLGGLFFLGRKLRNCVMSLTTRR